MAHFSDPPGESDQGIPRISGGCGTASEILLSLRNRTAVCLSVEYHIPRRSSAGPVIHPPLGLAE
jgi:hypothetical protein